MEERTITEKKRRRWPYDFHSNTAILWQMVNCIASIRRDKHYSQIAEIRKTGDLSGLEYTGFSMASCSCVCVYIY